MATYYTIAKNFKNDRLKVPIESKHVYKNPDSLTETSVLNNIYDYAGKVPTGESTHETFTATYGNKAEKQSATILYSSNYTGSTHYPNGWVWDQGTQVDQIIGNKIMIKSVRLHYEVSLNDKAFYWPISPYSIQKDSTAQGKADSKQNF